MYRIFSTRLTPLVVALGMVFWGLSPSAAMAVAADRCHYDVPGALDVSGLCQHDSGGADQRQAGSRGDLCHTPRSVVRFTGSDAPGHGHDVLVPSPPVISASAAAESRCPQIVGDDDGIATTAAMAKSAATTRAALTYTPSVAGLADDATIGIGNKISGQMSGRGWTSDLIGDTLRSPSRTVATRDTRWTSVGTRMDDPATAYIRSDGTYVVRNDVTGDIVQISNRNDPNWVAPWD